MAELMLEEVVRGRTAKSPVVNGLLEKGQGTSPDPVVHQFEFTGSGSEYFRIWVVNLLLTLLTFGIYSAWAKVRRLQYFYRNTRLDGAVFDYHGNPKAILKGRILAVVLLAAYQVSSSISSVATVLIILVMAVIMPWLLAKAFRFALLNTSYRGVRFHFRGTVGEAYARLILFPVVLAFTGLFVWSLYVAYSRSPGIGVVILGIGLPLLVLGSTIPLSHYYMKRYQHEQSDFGQTPFYFHASARDFFNVYGRTLGFVILGVIPATLVELMVDDVHDWLLNTMFGWLFSILYGVLSAYVFYLFWRSYYESRIQNLVWNHTEVGEHRFVSSAKARQLLWIHASNLALITITLGLYKPFAAIRLVKYRVESMVLDSGGSLNDFHADMGVDHANALGQEAGDAFNIDIAL